MTRHATTSQRVRGLATVQRAEALPGIAEQEAYLAEWDAILKRDEAALIERRAEYEWCRRGVESLKAARPPAAPPSRDIYEDAT